MGPGRRSGGQESLENTHGWAAGWSAPVTLPLVLTVAVLLRLAVGLHPYSGEVIRDRSNRTRAPALRAMLAHASHASPGLRDQACKLHCAHCLANSINPSTILIGRFDISDRLDAGVLACQGRARPQSLGTTRRSATGWS